MKNKAKISIVMPSYLGNYANAATLRELKIYRALDSVYNQTFQDFEILLISDSCSKTRAIYEDILLNEVYDNRLRYFEVERTGLWGGNPRNAGIENADSNLICYLDIDDMFKEDHLQFIVDNADPNTFNYFDDNIYNTNKKDFEIRKCNLVISHCGTGNIAHGANINSRWDYVGSYAHDWTFIKKLLTERQPKYLGSSGYCVCHIPKKYDV